MTIILLIEHVKVEGILVPNHVHMWEDSEDDVCDIEVGDSTDVEPLLEDRDTQAVKYRKGLKSIDVQVVETIDIQVVEPMAARDVKALVQESLVREMESVDACDLVREMESDDSRDVESLVQDVELVDTPELVQEVESVDSNDDVESPVREVELVDIHDVELLARDMELVDTWDGGLVVSHVKPGQDVVLGDVSVVAQEMELHDVSTFYVDVMKVTVTSEQKETAEEQSLEERTPRIVESDKKDIEKSISKLTFKFFNYSTKLKMLYL